MAFKSGECFVALPPNSVANSIVFGRNSLHSNDTVEEIVYFKTRETEPDTKTSGVSLGDICKYAVILSRPGGYWGADSGSNEKGVTIGLSWVENESSDSGIWSGELVRLALEQSSTASEAVDQIGKLVEEFGVTTSNGVDSMKCCLVLCDSSEVWLLNTMGKLWAAEQINSGFRAIPLGFSINEKIDRSCEDLQNKIKDLNLWDGSGSFNFAELCKSSSQTIDWSGAEPTNEFSSTSMFEILRNRSDVNLAASSHVSVIVQSGISCHWFTGTPVPRESVFKPFVFTAEAKISPLTKLPGNESTTLLNKLHRQRNWESVGELMKSLEYGCVEEVNGFLSKLTTPNQELDELMKDCVEAEVKFYR